MYKPRFNNALILGGGSGIGLALTHLLANTGTQVHSVDRQFTQVVESDCVSQLVIDVRDESLVSDVAEHTCSKFDVVVHCAAISAVGKFEKMSSFDLVNVMTINLMSPIRITRELLSHDMVKPHATHIYLSSLSHFTGYPGASAYAATKDGLATFARCIRATIGGGGGKVVVVYPGPTDTPHATQYSPNNSRKPARMSASVAAKLIYNAASRGQLNVVLGRRNAFFSIIARVFPGLSVKLMANWLMPFLNSNAPMVDREGSYQDKQ